MPFAEISAVAGGLKTAIDIIKNMKQTIDDVKTKEALSPLFDTIIDLQTHILSINAEYQSVLEERDLIRQEIVNLKNWDNEKEKYELFEPNRGTFVYIEKNSQKSGQSKYYLCANCFENNSKKSLLQTKSVVGMGRFSHFCPFCKNEYHYVLKDE